MSPSNAPDLNPLKRADAEPVFDELWQAQVLAMADTLVRQGKFSASAWSDALGAELKRSEAGGEEDNAASYYAAALRALESLLDGAGEVPANDLTARRDAWEKAYLSTPHGAPVELK